MIGEACGLTLLNMCYNNTIVTQTTFLHTKMYAVNRDVSVSGILSNKVKTDSMKSGSNNHNSSIRKPVFPLDEVWTCCHSCQAVQTLGFKRFSYLSFLSC